MRVNAIRMQRKSQPDDLVGILLSLARHIVFGDVGEVISVHVYRLFVRNGILILIKDFLKLSVLEI